ncbi:MAG TPA: hypothetical protein VKB95_16510, partial [Chitinophagaceae bacterium]|nr:hypothetical protein [Chitinophagaceae bacterium]
NEFSLQRSVTSLQAGGFTINIGLSYPSSVYNDPFRQQLDALKTVEQFNAWQSALKNDLIRMQARTQSQGEHISDGMITHRLSSIVSPAALDEAKSNAYNFISWPRIGQEVIVDYFDCTLEAGKAAVQNAISSAGTEPVNIEVIQSALHYAEQQAGIAKNTALKDAAGSSLKEDMLKLQQTINRESEQVQILNNIQKILHDASKAAVNNIRESVTPAVVAKVIRDGKLTDGEYFSFTAMPGNEFQIEMSSISSSLADWMNAFINGDPFKKSGNMVAADNNTKANSLLDFNDAMITEISFPELNAKNKNTPAMITLKFKPEEISFKNETDKTTQPAKPGNKKQWMPANFEIDLSGLSCKGVFKTEGFKITQKITEKMIGDVRKPVNIPGKLEYPNITFYIPAADSKPWMDWYKNFNKSNNTRTGYLKYMNDKGESLFSIPLNNVKPVEVGPVRDGSYKVTVKPESPDENRPDPVNDLIGFLDPQKKLLMVVPAYQEKVLNQYHAVKLADGHYRVQTFTASHQQVSMTVSMTLLPQLDIFYYSRKEEDSIIEVWVGKLNEWARNDTTMGTLKYAKYDTATATWSRVFKNAKCEEFEVAPENKKPPCMKWGKEFIQPKFPAEKHCKKGFNECIEYLLEWVMADLYEDAGCTKKTGSTIYELLFPDFRCK